MAAPVSQKEYLKRYLSGGDDDKKKKKKKKKDKSATSSKGMRIIEDNLDLDSVPYGYTEEDDNPTIAEVTYEDDKIKHMEEFEKNKKWKKIIADQEREDQECKRERDDISPPRRQRHDSQSPSPERINPERKRHDSDASTDRADSDTSPPRKRPNVPVSTSPPRRKRNDSDSSPPRRKRNDSDSSPPRRKRNDSDSSPPRRKGNESDSSPPRRRGEPQNNFPPPGASKEERLERKMTTQEYLRARKFGKLKKDTPEDLARKEREAVLQKKAEAQHQQWKHGVKQVQAYQQKLKDDQHEMGKAFARSADDVDMNTELKQVTREEDPMLEYMMKKQMKETKQPLKPLYKGPFPPNRFNIRPGYRWDGVDRSSGFENQWFERQNNRRAVEEDAYKWSVSTIRCRESSRTHI
ncbi:hypothetical protein C7M84_010281 [Penaeus vannamei]|uniref:BUD13 homolog n=1 Tax=Penaeus vannamei TaxID=6689 RepID=A0A3R7PMK9_PENVA|nr:hypothetical protein C7M84_010281 [Penaeus vannamei]